MNFTIDDADPSFAYSANGWAIQSPSDPDRDDFFQRTYHVATLDGATVSFQFQGSAFALYGSKGPGHANFQVQFDSTVVNLNAFAETTMFRQTLFAHTFSSNTSAQHFVQLAAILSGEDAHSKWLDVDYITFTSPNNASTSTILGTATSAPPWLTVSSTPGSSSTSSTSSAGWSSSTSSTKTPKILALLFGIILALVVVFLAVYFVLRRIFTRKRARERAFRYGQSSVNYASSAASGKTGSASGGGPSILEFFTRSGSRAQNQLSQQPEPAQYALVNGNGSGASMETREAGATTPSTRMLMSASPLLVPAPLPAPLVHWTRQKMGIGGGHKGDADSLRTDFLQV